MVIGVRQEFDRRYVAAEADPAKAANAKKDDVGRERDQFRRVFATAVGTALLSIVKAMPQLPLRTGE
jgi:hypothetical protein